MPTLPAFVGFGDMGGYIFDILVFVCELRAEDGEWSI